MYRINLVLREIRTYQWIKNILIFVPCIAGHTIFQSNNLFLLTMTFLAFSFTASSGYILNDIVDMEQDRLHPVKRFRPVAAGTMSILMAVALQSVLLILGIVFASFVDSRLPLLLLTYFAASTAYSIFFKKIFLADVVVLAVLYIFRIYIGAVIGGIILSKWLVTFSGLMFLCLAVMKRYGEIYRQKENANLLQDKLYKKSHGFILKSFGFLTAFFSCLVLGRYLYSNEVLVLYKNPPILVFAFLAMEGWLLRMWLFALRGRMTSDPIVFAIRDPASYLALTLMGVSIWLAI